MFIAMNALVAGKQAAAKTRKMVPRDHVSASLVDTKKVRLRRPTGTECELTQNVQGWFRGFQPQFTGTNEPAMSQSELSLN